MGLITPKPYQQYSRKLNKWIWVFPPPEEYSDKKLRQDNLIPEPYKPKRKNK